MIETFNNPYSAQDTLVLETLRRVAQDFCPDEVRAERQAILPDEQLNLNALELPFGMERPAEGGATASHPTHEALPDGNGFGIGIPETQKLRQLHYEEADTLDSDQIKKDFPILRQKVNGHDLVWLDNGATTQKPNVVIDKISDYYRNYNSNIHRGAHTLAARATDAYEEARQKIANFINAPSSDNIVSCVVPQRASTLWHRLSADNILALVTTSLSQN